MRKNQALYISAALLLSFFGQSICSLAIDHNNNGTNLVSLALVPDKRIIPEQNTTNSKNPDSFTPGVLEIAETIGILPLIQQIRAAQQVAKKISGQNNLLEKIVAQQKIIYLHTRINQYMQTANLELSSVIGKLNSGMAQLADSKALISDQRAKTLRRNTFINLVSGGLTKIGGYSTALTGASAIPTNVLEVIDGGVQVLLSISTIRQQRAESKFFNTKPEILTAFIRDSNDPKTEYPENVWTYVNRPLIPGSRGKSRREVLINSWIRSGRLISASGAQKRQNNANGQAVYAKEKIVMDDIDDAVAMMSDIKSTVSSMESSLMELSQSIKASYSDDPDF